MPMPNTWSRAAGLRAIELTRLPKMLPMPTPAPATPIAARPAPIIFAEVGSIASSFAGKLESGRRWRTRSVQMDRIAQVETAEDREHVSLQGANDDLEREHRDIDRDRKKAEEAERYREAGEHRHHRVAGHHVGEQPDAEAHRTRQVRNDLDRHQERCHEYRRSRRKEQAKEMDAVAHQTDDRHHHEHENGKPECDNNLPCKGKAIGNESNKIAEQDKHENRENQRKEFDAF